MASPRRIANYFVNFLTCDVKKTKTGKPYRLGGCSVIDNNEAKKFEFRHWDAGDELPLGLYQVRGGFNEYEGTEQFIVQEDPVKLEEIPDWVVDAFTSKNPDKSMTQEVLACDVLNALGLVKNPFIRKLVAICFVSVDWDWFGNDWEERIGDISGLELDELQDPNLAIYKVWGGRSIHHDYLGGLIAHSLEVLDIASSMSNTMLGVSGLSIRQKDIMIASALLHDLGKVLEYDNSSGACVESELGFFHKDHIFIGVRYVERIFRLIQNKNPVCDDPMMLEELVHVIAAHHGEWFRRITPRTFVAKLIQAGDLNSFIMARGRDFFLREPDAAHLDDRIGSYLKVR